MNGFIGYTSAFLGWNWDDVARTARSASGRDPHGLKAEFVDLVDQARRLVAVPDDAPAIAALRLALQDPNHARVLRAAQDVVTLLAGQDLYMDDLPPDPAPAAVWRRFAANPASR